jgi:hypothetical protein
LHVLCDNSKAHHPFEEWLSFKLRSKLREANMIIQHSHKPILLYRDTIEESNCASEEEVFLLAENHVIILLYAYGGFIPSEFQRVRIHTIDKFTKSILKKDRKDLLLQCLENLG